MTIDNGGPIDQLIKRACALGLFDLTPERRREMFVSWVLGNLNLSANHRTTRAIVEAAYDKMFDSTGQRKSEVSPSHQSIDEVEVCKHCGLNDGHHYVGCEGLKK